MLEPLMDAMTPLFPTKPTEVACDTETTGLGIFKADRPFGFSFTSSDGDNKYVQFPVDPLTRRVMYEADPLALESLKQFYADPFVTKIFHNANFDILMLNQIGIGVAGQVFDTQVLAHVFNPSRFEYGLKSLALDILKYPKDDESALQAAVVVARRAARKLEWKLGEDVEQDYWLCPELCEKYAVGDTERTMGLYKHFMQWYDGDLSKKPVQDFRATVDMEMRIVEAVRRMMARGHRIDMTVVRELEEYYKTAILTNTGTMEALGYKDLNSKSVLQMHKVFYEDLKLEPVMRTRKDKKTRDRKQTPTTDTEALDKWAREGVPLAKCLVELSAARYQLSTFILPFGEQSAVSEDGTAVLHPSYKTLGATTGRMSCLKPNLLNISDDKSGKRRSDVHYRARECFIPRDGHLLYYPDYTQIEVWAAAYLAQDKLLIKQLLSGADMHGINAKAYWGHLPDFEQNFTKYRKKAKTVTFGCLYGAGAGAISSQAEVSLEEAKRIHGIFWKTYSGLYAYSKALARLIERRGFIVNPFGRRYIVHPEVSYKAMNFMVQGSSCEVLKRALLNVDELFRTKYPDCHLLLAIHDELVAEVPVASHGRELMLDIEKAMQADFHTYFKMPDPFKIGMSFTSTNWSQKEEITIERMAVE